MLLLEGVLWEVGAVLPEPTTDDATDGGAKVEEDAPPVAADDA